MTEAQTLADACAIYLDTSVLPKIDMEGGNSPQSRLVRLLIYGSRVPVFCSLVSLGEFFKVAGSRRKQAEIGSMGYLHSCRALLTDFERKIQRVEPPAERWEFLKLADEVVARRGVLGGGDVWHLMAALQLKASHDPAVLFTFDPKLARAAEAEGIGGVYGNRVDPEVLIAELTARSRWIPA